MYESYHQAILPTTGKYTLEECIFNVPWEVSVLPASLAKQNSYSHHDEYYLGV